MREEDTSANPVEKGCHRAGDHTGIVGASIRRHRSEELVENLRVPIKLHIVKKVRPLAEPELVEKELVVWRWFDRRCDGTIAGATAARLIDEINRKSMTQEYGLNPSRPSGVVSQLLADW